MKKLFITIICLSLFNALEAQSWDKVSAGTEFSVALGVDGTLWSWGFNGNGQLGANSPNLEEDLPIQIGMENNWKDVSTGGYHCLALKKDGTLWAWGLNGNGQVGNGTNIQQNIPVQIGTDDDWQSIEGGQAHSFAIKENGTLWAWGYNFFAQLGNNSTNDSNAPAQIGDDNDWWIVRGGGAHSLALKTDSTMWAWGANFNGQLGMGNTTQFLIPTNTNSGNGWTDIDAGFEFSVGTKEDGSLMSWGFNGNGQLGNGSTIEENSPQQIADTINFISVSAGSAYGVAISENHELYGWGANLYGELGLGNTTQQNNVTQIGTDDNWVSVSAAEGGVTTAVFGFHTLGLKEFENDICVTGANYAGQLGVGSATSQSTFSCNVGEGLINALVSINKSEEIEIYPNPVDGNHFSIIQAHSESIMTLTDLTGKIWKTQRIFSQEHLVECEALPSGIYIITIRVEDWIYSDKLFKL